MLFQLVTGRLPFNADSPLAIAYAHVQEEPVAPSSINQALPPAVDALVARALRKNPNERFPSAEVMREECLRAASFAQAGPPSIVPGACATPSGSGVASAVFPPVGQALQPPHGQAQTPYPPAPAPNPYHQASTPGYGYPQQGDHASHPLGYGPQGASTPPPYTTVPQQTGRPDGAGRRPVVVGSVAVAAIVAVGLIVALTLKNTGDDTEGGGTGSSASAPAPASHPKGYRGPDPTRRIDTDKCTDAQESYNDPDKIQLPDFRYKDIRSVKECMQAAGWKWNIQDTDDNTWGDGTVLDQFPAQGTDVDEDYTGTIELRVSTGNPPQ
jgi:hypothetical protein